VLDFNPGSNFFDIFNLLKFDTNSWLLKDTADLKAVVAGM
jgi:hypothetical protein